MEGRKEVNRQGLRVIVGVEAEAEVVAAALCP